MVCFLSHGHCVRKVSKTVNSLKKAVSGLVVVGGGIFAGIFIL
jgi:hypothetical protein